MTKAKKTRWTSALFVLMFSLYSGIVAASDSTTLSFPGNGYVGVSLHTEIPDDLSSMISGITQQPDINHCWVTATVAGVQGVIHSDGATGGVNFICWPEFLTFCVPGSIQLFKPNIKAIGYAELESLGINLSFIPPIFRQLLAYQLGNLMINIWIQEMLSYAYSQVPYDYFFMPGDDAIYCSELLAHGWNNIGSSIDLFPSQEAGTLPGWDNVKYLLWELGYEIEADTAVYDVGYILKYSDPNLDLPPYFEKISVD
jgi:hypothetical protein